jgi:hypothetical protein
MRKSSFKKYYLQKLFSYFSFFEFDELVELDHGDVVRPRVGIILLFALLLLAVLQLLLDAFGMNV